MLSLTNDTSTTTTAPVRQDESLLSITLLATGDAASIGESLTTVLEYCVGVGRADITLVLHGAAVEHEYLFSAVSNELRVISAPAEADINEAWTLGLSASSSRWALLMTQDVRLTHGWMNPILAFLSEHPDVTALTPTVSVNGRAQVTASPDQATGVCLLVSRSALINDAIGDVVQIEASVVESTMFNPASAPVDTATRLNLGCGNNQFSGWTNIDADGACTPDLVMDLRKPLPFEDNTVDAIYSEEFFEQFTLEQALPLYTECFRVLKPGGVMRTAMPDLRDLVVSYLGRWNEQSWIQNYSHVDSPTRMLNIAMREWGHKYIYDYDEMALRLRNAGFVNVVACSSGESALSYLCGLEKRPESKLIVEATKL